MTASQSDSPVLGAIYVALGGVFIALNALFVHLASQYEPIYVTTFASFAVSFVILAVLAIRARLSLTRDVHAGLLLIRAAVGVSQIFFLYIAIQTIPLVDAVLLRAASPLWVALLQVAVLRRPIPRIVWLLLLVGFAGVAIVIHPQVADVAVGYGFGVAGGILFAVQGLLSRHLHEKGEPLLRILIVVMGVGTCAFIAPAVTHIEAFTLTSAGLGIAVGVSLLAGTACAVQGYKYAPAYVVAPFTYASVIASALLGWALFDHAVTLSSWFGILLVMIGGVGVVRVSRV
ncbi:MAG: DMT family transporter [Pseudomonadota bacterium]